MQEEEKKQENTAQHTQNPSIHFQQQNIPFASPFSFLFPQMQQATFTTSSSPSSTTHIPNQAQAQAQQQQQQQQQQPHMFPPMFNPFFPWLNVVNTMNGAFTQQQPFSQPQPAHVNNQDHFAHQQQQQQQQQQAFQPGVDPIINR